MCFSIGTHPFAKVDISIGMTNSQEAESQWLLSGSGLFLALHGWKGQGWIGKCGDCRWSIVDESAAMNGERSRLSFPIHGTVVGSKTFFSAECLIENVTNSGDSFRCLFKDVSKLFSSSTMSFLSRGNAASGVDTDKIDMAVTE